MEKIRQGEIFCEKVKAIVKGAKSDSELKETFKKEFAKTNENERIAYAATWLTWALNVGERQLAERFFEAFFEDFERFDPWLIARTVMRIEGIEDIEYLDSWGDSRDEPQGGPLGFSDLKQVSEIYARSKYSTPLLIVGETGTSKEFLAKAIHKMSDRRKGPFEEINCAAIPENLFESELFGFEKGAFTGAVNSKKGIWEIADKGTVFLDEIGKMPKRLQAKLLKVVDEGKIRHLGSEKVLAIDVRLIAAVQPKNIRAIIPDLFLRLNGLDYIQMPTLKERLTHDPLSYVMVINKSKDLALRKMDLKKNITISQSAYDKLQTHEYRGNYRELESILTAAIRRAQLKKRDEILVEDLEETMSKSKKYFEEEISSKSEGESDLRDIKLTKIIDYAETKKVSIIKTKIKEVLRSGKDLKTVLKEEGTQETGYQNFLKKVRTITGKKIKELD